MSITITTGMIFVACYVIAKGTPSMISTVQDKRKEKKRKEKKEKQAKKKQ